MGYGFVSENFIVFFFGGGVERAGISIDWETFIYYVKKRGSVIEGKC